MASISRKQLFALFLSSLIMWTILQGLLTMLPVYALRLEAEPASIGNYLAFAFFAMAVGGVIAGWLSDKFQRRKTWMIVTTFMNIFATWFMSRANSFGQLVIITGIVCFLASMAFSMIGILAG
jgi:MFS family permease